MCNAGGESAPAESFAPAMCSSYSLSPFILSVSRTADGPPDLSALKLSQKTPRLPRVPLQTHFSLFLLGTRPWRHPANEGADQRAKQGGSGPIPQVAVHQTLDSPIQHRHHPTPPILSNLQWPRNHGRRTSGRFRTQDSAGCPPANGTPKMLAGGQRPRPNTTAEGGKILNKIITF